MKYLRKCLIGLGVLLLVAALLLWFLPARWAMAWIEPQLHGVRLQQVHGTLWQGRADEVVLADRQSLGQLQWQLSRRTLLGKAQLQLDFHGPSLSFSGGMRGLADNKIQWHAVRLHARLDSLGADLTSPLGVPRGELQVTVDHALLQGGWPLQMQANV